MRALLVDDSLVFRRAQAKVLKSLGVAEIFEAENGKEALEILAKENFDVNFVILDINMPVLGGIETLGFIRQYSTDLPVIMCTSEAGKEKIMQSLKAGANTYLLKPVKKDDMLQKIRDYMPSQA